MKKFILLGLTTISILSFTTFGKTTLAADRGNMPRAGILTEADYFGGQSDDTEYIRLPDGGYLHGEATIENINNGTKMYVDSSKSEDVLTLKDVKKELSEPNIPNIELRRTTPASSVYSLSYGANYISNSFTGSGWRFAGYLFKAVNSAGPDLRWESHHDGGAIGTETQAWNTLDSGYAEGTLINKDAYLYLSGTKTYYNHNPQNSPYYYVGNVD